MKPGKAIKSCRLAVINRRLVVPVAGRLFAEASVTAKIVGADHAGRSAPGSAT